MLKGLPPTPEKMYPFPLREIDAHTGARRRVVNYANIVLRPV